MAAVLVEERQTQRTKVATIDCDIHNNVPSEEAITPYLPVRWQNYHRRYGMRSYRFTGAYYPRVNPAAARHDAWPPNGASPGSDLPFLREQLLDTWDIEYGILNPLIDENAPSQANLEYGAAIATALNNWQIDAWLDPEPRLRASMVVQLEDGDLAAAEVERLATTDSRFVQILLVARTPEPLGKRRYWKLYEAAQRHNLPIGIHFGGVGGHAITGSGWPSFYLEDHVGMPQTMQSQVISYVFEGVFEEFPNLKIVLIEGGMAWLPSLMWRMDRAWEQMRDEVPHLTRPPSEYVRRNFWLTTQPMEEPPIRAHFHQFLDQLNMSDRLMFATDYPHWDFDAPDQAIPVRLDPTLERMIMADNARALYRL